MALPSKKTLFTTLVVVLGVFLLYSGTASIVYPRQVEKNFKEHVVKATAEQLQLNHEREQRINVEIADFTEKFPLNFLPTLEASTVIGGIYLPSTETKAPIVLGTDKSLANSAFVSLDAFIFGQGNIVLGSNNNIDKVTGAALLHAKKGDTIYITDKQHIYHYQVTDRLLLRKGREDVALPRDKAVLTLITGHQNEKGELEQVVIRSELVTSADYTQEQAGELYEVFGN